MKYLIIFIFLLPSVSIANIANVNMNKKVDYYLQTEKLRREFQDILLQKNKHALYFGLRSDLHCSNNDKKIEIYDDAFIFLDCHLKIPIKFIRRSNWSTEWSSLHKNYKLLMSADHKYLLQNKTQIFVFDTAGNYLMEIKNNKHLLK